MAATSRRTRKLGYGHTPSEWQSFGDGIFGSEFGKCSVMVYSFLNENGGTEYAYSLFNDNNMVVHERDGYTSLRDAVDDADDALIDLVLG